VDVDVDIDVDAAADVHTQPDVIAVVALLAVDMLVDVVAGIQAVAFVAEQPGLDISFAYVPFDADAPSSLPIPPLPALDEAAPLFPCLWQ